MSLATTLQKQAYATLKRYGESAVLISKAGKASFNDATGTVVRGSDVSTPCYMQRGGMSHGFAGGESGSMTREVRIRATVHAWSLPQAPRVGDAATLGGTTYTIVGVNANVFKDVPITYELILV